MADATLFVVATPIGNLGDLSPRARETLESVDLIAAEDTRHTGRLLAHFGISKRQVSIHEHNERDSAEAIIARLREGLSVALVSDAGTPLLSDPGYRLLHSAHAAGIRVSPVPGPSAMLAAVSVAGLPSDRLCFEGFLPARAAARAQRLATLAAEPRTMVFYESVHRLGATLDDMVSIFGAERPAFLGRELSKLHEQCIATSLAALADGLARGQIPTKGEFVLVVQGSKTTDPVQPPIDIDALLRELVQALPGRQAVEIVARLSGRGRNPLYRRMLELSGAGGTDSDDSS